MVRPKHPATEPLVSGLAIALILGLLATAYALVRQTVSNDSGNAIRAVIRADAHHFRSIREKQQLWDPADPEDLEALARLGKTYHRDAAALNLNACPPDFRRAYRQHLTNWDAVASALARLANEPSPRGLDQKHAFRQRAMAATEPLNDSWKRVRRIAQAHGVYIKA